MEWDWPEPDLEAIGALAFTGICLDTSRVVRQAILPNFANLGAALLAALLLANDAACSVLSPRVVFVLDDGFSLPDLVPDLPAIITLALWLHCTAVHALCVASLYLTADDLLAADRVLKEDDPVIMLRRLLSTFLFVAVPFLVVSTLLSVAAPFLWVWLEVETLPPQGLLGWAIVVYVAVVGQLACVVSVLEDAACFGAVRRSRELLAGKFCTVACVFVTLHGCIIAVLKAFAALVVHDALGLGWAFQVAAGTAMFVALYAVLVVALVAQPVVYMVCKSYPYQQGGRAVYLGYTRRLRRH